MSILLDALRKSEQRERLGAVPDIHGMDAPTTGDGRPAWILPAALAVSLLLLLAIGYGGWRWWASPRIPASSAESATAPFSEPSRADPAAGDSAPPAQTPSLEVPIRVDRQPRSPVETLSGDAPYQAAERTDPVTREPTPATVRSDAESGASPADPRPAEAVSAASDTAFGSEAGAPRTAGSAGASGSDRPAESSQRSAPVREARDETGLISYWQLPQHTRDNLPPFKINVLVYDEAPESRFIIMGGKRYLEGDQLNKSLHLSQIRRDRVVFRYGVYRFYVKQ